MGIEGGLSLGFPSKEALSGAKRCFVQRSEIFQSAYLEHCWVKCIQSPTVILKNHCNISNYQILLSHLLIFDIVILHIASYGDSANNKGYACKCNKQYLNYQPTAAGKSKKWTKEKIHQVNIGESSFEISSFKINKD